MFSKSALVLTTAAAIALTSFDLRPAQAAPESGPAIAKQNGADEFSAQRKRRRGAREPGRAARGVRHDRRHHRGHRGGRAPARLLRASVLRRPYAYELRAYGYAQPRLRAAWLRATARTFTRRTRPYRGGYASRVMARRAGGKARGTPRCGM